jgi:hypothetical protein
MAVAFYQHRKKSWQLSAAIKPQKRYPLSGVVRILDHQGAGYCHIKFSWSLVADVGKAMPRGIGDHEPAYLQAMRNADGSWYIFCCYLEGSTRRIILQEPSRPSWIKSIKRKTVEEVDE